MEKLLYKAKQQIRLAAEEKARMREALRAHIAAVPPQMVISSDYEEQSRWLTMQILSYRSVTAFTLVVMLLASSVSFAAASALPGETLYAIKRQVNERVKTALALSPDAQIAVHTGLAIERLSEAERLAQAGKLSPKARIAIEDDFRSHAVIAKAKVAELVANNREEHAVEASLALESALDAHTQILLTLGANKDNIQPELGRLLVAVTSDQAAGRTRGTAQAKMAVRKQAPATKVAAEEKLNAVRSQIKHVAAYVAKSDKQAGAQASGSATLKLVASEEAVLQGQAKLRETGGESDAIALAQEADRLAREAKILVKASADLSLGAAATPVPVALVSAPTMSAPAIMSTSTLEGTTTTMVGGGSATGLQATTTTADTVPALTPQQEKEEPISLPQNIRIRR
ncbi:MAG: hypothetical protein A2542_03010 [Parcubacteria group bacterium RIFOXYD2_FULL_52_8]|nr:MAG: hypothetical protein A2542_03010 [Parcubacteria group bacterium RIFOXYD2_FULL_52_8]